MDRKGYTALEVNLDRNFGFDTTFLKLEPKRIIERRNTTENVCSIYPANNYFIDQIEDGLPCEPVPNDNPVPIILRLKTTDCSITESSGDVSRSLLPMPPILKKMKNIPFAIKGRPKSVTFPIVSEKPELPKAKRPVPALIPILLAKA